MNIYLDTAAMCRSLLAPGGLAVVSESVAHIGRACAADTACETGQVAQRQDEVP